MNKIFLSRLYDSLEGARVAELQGLHDFFGKFRIFDWTGPGHLKALCWLRSQRDGEFDSRQISGSISVVGPQGELWPGALMIPRIVSNLSQIGLIKIGWAKTGLREIQPFRLRLDTLREATRGSLWDRLAPVILGASFKEIQALAALYTQTNLAEQPGFYLRVLAWCAAMPGDRMPITEIEERFDDVKRQVRSSHDMRNIHNALSWAYGKELIVADWGTDDFRLDATPLCSLGFETNQTTKEGNHE